MQQYYDHVEEVWSSPSVAMSAVTLVSIAGGERDVMVPAHLSIVPMTTAISLAVGLCVHVCACMYFDDIMSYFSIDFCHSTELGLC